MAHLDPKELKMALREAARMREKNEDPYFLGRSVLNQNFRIKHLERVMELADKLASSCEDAELAEELGAAITTVRELNKKKKKAA